jgi:ankyrin repeat protein
MDIIKNENKNSEDFFTRYGIINKENVFDRINNKEIALDLIKTEKGLELLKNIKNDGGITALHKAIWHEEVAFELIKTDQKIKLLAETKDDNGFSALYWLILYHDKISRSLSKTPEGMQFVIDVKRD